MMWGTFHFFRYVDGEWIPYIFWTFNSDVAKEIIDSDPDLVFFAW